MRTFPTLSGKGPSLSQWLLAALIALLCAPAVQAQNSRVFYAGGMGQDRFHDSYMLSDSTWLIAGGADDLDWLPQGTSVSTLSLPSTSSNLDENNLGPLSNSTQVAFLLHVDKDMSNIQEVVRLPDNSLKDIYRIKATTPPGQKTGTLYLSGNRKQPEGERPGYTIMELDDNFVDGTPSSVVHFRDVTNRGISNDVRLQIREEGFEGGQQSNYVDMHVWDVFNDGRITYLRGQEYSDAWAQFELFKPNMRDHDTLNFWPVTWARVVKKDNDTTTTELRNLPNGLQAFLDNVGTPQSFRPQIQEVLEIQKSGIVMKNNRGGANLRSGGSSNYNQRPDDANGNADTLYGSMPDDVLLAGPVQGSSAPKGANPNSGIGAKRDNNNVATNLVGFIEIDKRNNHMYMGYSTQVNNNGAPDFMASLVAFDEHGKVKWYDHLHELDKANPNWDREHFRGVALDYANDKVVACTHVSGVDSSRGHNWLGSEIALNPASEGFQDKFTGVKNLQTIGWLGRYGMDDGRIYSATYVGEYEMEGNPGGTPHSDANIDMPDPNTGSPNLDETTIENFKVAPNGDIAIIASGMRTITTNNGYQRSPLLSDDDSTMARNTFVRVYDKNLATLKYSSLLTSQFETETGKGSMTSDGDLATRLVDVHPMANSVVVTGYHKGMGANPLPTTNKPMWGTDTLSMKGSGMIANLSYVCDVPQSSGLGIESLSDTGGDPCSNTELQYRVIDPVADDGNRASDFDPDEDYVWIITGPAYTGHSTSDSIMLTATGASGATMLTLMVRNNCGLSKAATISLPSAGTQPNKPETLEIENEPDSACWGAELTVSIPLGDTLDASDFTWRADTTVWEPVNNTWVTNSPSIAITPKNPGIQQGGDLWVKPRNNCGFGDSTKIALPAVKDTLPKPMKPEFDSLGSQLVAMGNGSDFTNATFMWFANGQQVMGEVGDTLDVSDYMDADMDEINFRATLASGCKTPMSGVTTVQVTGLDGQLPGNSFQLYPNPTNGNLNLELGEQISGQVQIQVFDVLGKQQMSESFSKESSHLRQTINMSNLPQGIYFVEVSNGERTAIRKISKQ